MRPTLLFFCIFVIASVASEDAVAEIATFLEVRKEAITYCFKNSMASYSDIMEVDRIITDDLEYNYGTMYEKVGCFFACIIQVEGLMVNTIIRVDVILQNIDSGQISDLQYAMYNKIIMRCASRVEDMHDRCEVAFYFIMCILKDKRDYEMFDI